MTPLMSDGKIKVIAISKKRNSYLVIFDNDKKLLLSIEQLLDYRISLDRILDDEEFILLEKEINRYFWYEKCLKYLSQRLRTKKQLNFYLEKSDLTQEEKKKIIDKLTENNFLDDERFVKFFFEDCIQKGKGFYYFKNVLEKHDINRDLIDEYINLFKDDTVIEMLIQKYKLTNKELTQINKYKIINNMLRNGIFEDVIEQVIKNIENNKEMSE